MASPYNVLGLVMEKFHALDPHIYEQYLRALDAVAFEVTAAVTTAPNDEILRAAGRAQTAQKFLQLASEIPALQPPSPPFKHGGP